MKNFTTITRRFPFETTTKAYSDEEAALFEEEAKSWRIVRFYNNPGIFEGDYALLFKTAGLCPDAVFPPEQSDYLIENGKLVGVEVTCGYFDINGGMGGWRGSAIPLYFDKYEETIQNREKYSYTKYTSYSSEKYCSAILPISIIESLPEFIIDGTELIGYWGKDRNVVIPDGIRKIGYHAFSKCEFIESVTFPESLRIIGTGSFEGTGLKEIVTSVKISEIKSNAFSYCRNLKKAIFPSCTCIDDTAFDHTSIEIEKPDENPDDDYDCISAEEYYRYKN